MGRTKYDPDTLGREYAALRTAAGGVLTQQDFFKAKGIPFNYGCRKFGQILNRYWERTRQKAETEIAKRTGINLAREMGELFNKHKELVRRGYAKITAPGPNGKEVPLKDLEDALVLFQQGSQGLRDIVKIMAGGQPVQPPRNVEPEFRWNEPISPTKRTPRNYRALAVNAN